MNNSDENCLGHGVKPSISLSIFLYLVPVLYKLLLVNPIKCSAALLGAFYLGYAFHPLIA